MPLLRQPQLRVALFRAFQAMWSSSSSQGTFWSCVLVPISVLAGLRRACPATFEKSFNPSGQHHHNGPAYMLDRWPDRIYP